MNFIIDGDIAYIGTQAYIRVGSKNSLFNRMISNNAEDAHSFKFCFGRYTDEDTVKKYAKTFWMRASNLDIKIANKANNQEMILNR